MSAPTVPNGGRDGIPDRGPARTPRRGWAVVAAALTLSYPLAVFMGLRRWPLAHDTLVKLAPVLVNGVLLAAFARSLRAPRSMVERFARRQDPDLSPEKVRYCRTATAVWCGLFVLNIAATVGLAVAAPLSWWSLYTGIVANALMGGLFIGEYVVRKWRFRDYGARWHDRWLARLWPPKDDGA